MTASRMSRRDFIRSMGAVTTAAVLAGRVSTPKAAQAAREQEKNMQFGFVLPHIGSAANTRAILQAAQRAEALGFDSLWVTDRLLWPLHPSTPYPGTPDGRLPMAYQTVYDPLAVLIFVAARTQRVRLGTSVLVAPYRNPVIMAKMGATLDSLSGGRFIFGVGVGWSPDEFTAVGESLAGRDARTDEYLRVIKELWTKEEPHFTGKYYHLPASIFLPKPVQKPHPPIWIGGQSHHAFRRAAKLGDGWNPTNRLSPEALTTELDKLRAEAKRAGRNPEEITIALRWNGFPPLGRKSGAEEILRTLRRYEEVGVRHVFFDMNIPAQPPLPVMLETMERLTQKVFPAFQRSEAVRHRSA